MTNSSVMPSCITHKTWLLRSAGHLDKYNDFLSILPGELVRGKTHKIESLLEPQVNKYKTTWKKQKCTSQLIRSNM